MIPKRLPHLERALRFASTEGQHGSCFHRAVALVLDFPPAILAIGTLRAATDEELEWMPAASTVPFIHAWVEVGDEIYAPTLVERVGGLAPIPRAIYYQHNGIEAVRRLKRAEVKRLAVEHGWSRHFLKNDPPRLPVSIGRVVLEAAGVAYRMTETGGVIPA